MDDKKSAICWARVTYRWQTSTRFLFRSSLRSQGTYFAHTRLMPNSTVTICWTLSNDTFKLPGSSLDDNLLSSYRNCLALSVFTSVTTVIGLPLRVDKLLSIKCFHHWNTIAWLIVSIPHVFCNISNSSLSPFPGFTQNYMPYFCLKTY
jgi:hypothetical protein